MENMINLETFADGALAEKVNMALKEVLANITDLNTDYKVKRKLTVDMTLESDEARELTEINIVAKTKLAPSKALSAKIVIGTDGKGNVLASEYKKQIPGQSVMRVDEENNRVVTTAEEKEFNTEGIKLVK
ncbi:replication terminator protein [Clostridium beijerinckii]|uniref:Replication terminator protein n=1 Tax=Clostridium beijerinckii TaxID=1520 RepID=A0A7X9SMD3_CLOBE|nr:replication terminator protein [Clostridium beijerinckii]NMF04544.1 replication terminator protein [Clostridium beijerinckii]